MSDSRERRAPLDPSEFDPKPTPPVPNTGEDEGDILVRLSRDSLKEAIVDALRLDYQGRLAKVCETAIDAEAPVLRDFVHTLIGGVLEDEEFVEGLRVSVRRRLTERFMAKVDAHVKRTPAHAIEGILKRTEAE